MNRSPRGKGYIVLVEPDDLLRALLERWLGEAGYIVKIEREVAERDGGPVLVVANFDSPRRSEAAIRALGATYQVPILAMSARFHAGAERSGEVARRLGVCEVVPKPFTREELIAAVRNCLGEAV